MILWTARLLSKSDHGMATPELMEVHNDDDVVDIINCVALYHEKLRRSLPEIRDKMAVARAH